MGDARESGRRGRETNRGRERRGERERKREIEGERRKRSRLTGRMGCERMAKSGRKCVFIAVAKVMRLLKNVANCISACIS